MRYDKEKMRQIKQFISWLSKAWPFIFITFIWSVHFNVLKVCPTDSVELINKYVSSLTQIVGGLIILFNINSNLGLFDQNNLLNIFTNWLKSFPLFRKLKTNTGHCSGTLPGLTGHAEGSSNRICNTLEEKIEEAQRQINELRKLIYRKEGELLTKISNIEITLKNLIYKNQNDIQELNNLISKSTVGGINAQIFGVLLVVYGAIFPLILAI